MPIRCEIVTQERMVFSEDVDSVNLPGIEGRMGILPHHSPLLTVLDFGEVIIKQAGREEYFAIGGGFAEVQPDKVIILADSAEHAEEIDEAKAEEVRQKAVKAMAEGPTMEHDVYEHLQNELRRANLRLDVGRRRKTGRHRTMAHLSGEEE